MPPTQRNEVAVRATEGPKDTGAVSRGKGGRPVGSKNKPKSLIPTELAEAMLLTMEKQLPPEHFAYMKGVIKDGKAISTKQELDALVLLLSRNLYPALISETMPHIGKDEDGEDVDTGPVFRRDVTERLKVLNSLLSLRHQIDKRDDGDNGEQKPLLKVWADRNLNGRFAILVDGRPLGPSGDEQVGLAGDADRAGRGADEARAVPNPLPERPLALPSGEQGEADWLLDGDSR